MHLGAFGCIRMVRSFGVYIDNHGTLALLPSINDLFSPMCHRLQTELLCFTLLNYISSSVIFSEEK